MVAMPPGMQLALLAAVVALVGGAFGQSTASGDLKLVLELCRHGDRSPIVYFPGDKYEEKDWYQGYGQLTATGMRSHYLLGESLRQRYVPGLLSRNYSRIETRVYSTDVDRTIQSAESQMAGLYPPGTGPLTQVNGLDPVPALPERWAALPVHTIPVADDSLLRAYDSGGCPRYDALMKGRREWEEVRKYAAEHQPLFDLLTGITGHEVDIHNVYRIHDSWVCELAHGRPLVAGATADVVEQVRQVAEYTLGLMFRQGPDEGRPGEVARLTAGNLVRDIRDTLSARLQPQTPEEGALRFKLYSAHDTTVAALLSALGLWDGGNPPYNSTVFFELHGPPDSADPARHAVRMFFNGRRVAAPGEGEGADGAPLPSFGEAVGPVAVESQAAWLEECGKSPSPSSPSPNPPPPSCRCRKGGGGALGSWPVAGASLVAAVALGVGSVLLAQWALRVLERRRIDSASVTLSSFQLVDEEELRRVEL